MVKYAAICQANDRMVTLEPRFRVIAQVDYIDEGNQVLHHRYVLSSALIAKPAFHGN